MKPIRVLFVSACIFLLTNCQFFKKEPVLFTLLAPQDTGIAFKNTITETDSLNILTYGYMYNGGGVAVGDVNNDGLPDLYFSGNMVSGKLYLNKGNFKFEDITAQSGTTTNLWVNGVTMIDINQDGLLDIYACTVNPAADTTYTPNLLFVNKGMDAAGKPVFKEEGKAYNLADEGNSTQAAFFDYDKDQDLDMYLLRNATDNFDNPNVSRPKITNGTSRSTDKLFRNNGNNTFTDVSKEAGILIEGRGLGIAVSDINQDGWPDVYAANDFLSNDLLWINNQDGTFTNKISQYLKHTSYNGMGTDIADYNNDGLPDIIEMDMLPEDNKRQKLTMEAPNYERFSLTKRLGYEYQYVRNTLQLNNGNGTFSEIGQLAGVYATDWSWSALLADYDNDGWRDLFITNGYLKDMINLDYIHYQSQQSMFGTQEAMEAKLKKEFNKLQSVIVPNYIYQNKHDLTFENKTTKWGLEKPSTSNGAAYADLDNDGDLDLVINNLNSAAFVYRNNTETVQPANFIKLNLQGQKPNQEGIGATVKLKSKGQQQFYEHYLTRGYQSSQSKNIHFGLGKVTTVDSLEINWPDGRFQLLTNVPANQTLKLNQENAVFRKLKVEPEPAPLFRKVNAEYGIAFKHEENDYVDFKNQPLLPHKYSQTGPGLTVGDVNGDGLDDFYVGGSGNYTGTIFYQTKQGRFTNKPLSHIPNKADDTGALFFDADGDADLDLYVVSGGNEFRTDANQYRHRLYQNDGKGNFMLDSLALPRIVASGSCVTAADFDKDGDLDLFIGGRNEPQKYPLPGQSCILRNQGGRFSNVTKQVCPELERAGMVTSALWTDFDNDNQIDLLVTGEWMPICFYKNNKGNFTNVTASMGLQNSNGWWNSLMAGDFDNDGDMDYVAGNLGLNSKYKASPEQPVSVYAKDFDKNGSIDPVISYFIQNTNYPAPPRDALTDQIVAMRRRFPRYSDYGTSSMDALFTDEELKDATKYKSYTFASSYIQNNGNGKFTLQPLPINTQYAPVFGMNVADFNYDGNLDILLVGNSFATETALGYYDASNGTCLLGNGNGTFKTILPKAAGLKVSGDAKAIARVLNSKNQPLEVITCNADSLQVLQALNPVGKNQVIRLSPMDAYADLVFKNGKKRREEFFYGAGYLSQSSRAIVSAELATVAITDFSGKQRQIKL
ncbi:FG-GAP-like repeat-containing protein [Adhaeribacter radiodurans]|uniref:VCBS repeat-containing protein n=1 Tax=Adhaeribacter radiodurans TaxID=2745197 RepID=A0A7L7LAJ9_9BACT|nr:FG-GAP-like repeat-containing protein [Adhaeribacter radiodurans]QMU29856.1 VCBS repeat-containing protein [Adhaeribacter radiodurans]